MEPLKNGFTLIELLLYVAMIATMLLAIASFLPTVYDGRVKRQSIEEVEAQGAQAMELILRSGRNASSLTAPSIGTSAGSLTLAMASTTLNPTVYTVTPAGVIIVAEAGGTAIPLTNSRVTTTAFSVANISKSGTPGTMRVMFTLKRNTISDRMPYAYEKTFYGSASLHD